MREINECTAEVFRRSNARIRKRRRTCYTIAMLCAVCICAMIIAPMMLAKNNTKKSEHTLETGNLSQMSGAPESFQIESINVFVSAEIKGDTNDYYKLVEDSSEVEKIYSAIIKACDSTTTEIAFESVQTTKNTTYDFSFEFADGTAVTYRLTGNILNNATENLTFTLDDEQLSILQKTLGLPD